MQATPADTDEEPRIAQKGPYRAELLATYRYAWCRCGLSKMQPWCDGSHTSTKTGIMPVVWTQDQDKTVFLCGCKRSGNKPFCDSTHKTLWAGPSPNAQPPRTIRKRLRPRTR